MNKRGYLQLKNEIWDVYKRQPQYTRPEVFEGEKVPEILLSGHHENISKWRKEKMCIRDSICANIYW